MCGRARSRIDIKTVDTDRRAANELSRLNLLIGLYIDSLDYDLEIDLLRVFLDESDRSLGVASSFGLQNGNDSCHLWW